MREGLAVGEGARADVGDGLARAGTQYDQLQQIGRATCRERVEISVAGVAVENGLARPGTRCDQLQRSEKRT